MKSSQNTGSLERPDPLSRGFKPTATIDSLSEAEPQARRSGQTPRFRTLAPRLCLGAQRDQRPSFILHAQAEPRHEKRYGMEPVLAPGNSFDSRWSRVRSAHRQIWRPASITRSFALIHHSAFIIHNLF